MERIGIIGAMTSEIDHLVARLESATEQVVAHRTFYTGTLNGHTVVVVESGIGKVAAAVTAQILIDRFAVDALINTGMAGGLDETLRVRDLVIGTAAVQHDFNLKAFGHVRGFLYGDDDQRPTHFVADDAMVEAAKRAAAHVLPPESRVVCGLIASGDLFVEGPYLKQKIREKFSAAAAEMEGAAIAQTAVANDVPFVILRTISDMADGNAFVSFQELERYVGRLAGDLTAALLEEL